MKKLVSVLLCISMLLSVCVSGASAANAVDAVPVSFEEDLKNLCNEIDAYFEKVGCVGEIMAIKGECQEKLHLLDEAGHSYEIAYRTVKNGMIFHKLSCKGIGGYEK